MFIAIEGGEGVGKTTQVRLLEKHLPALYPTERFCFTRQPGGAPFAEHIYKLFKDGMRETSAATQFGLVLASRFDHLEKVIRPRLTDGEVVITDRYDASTYSYQVMAMPELMPMYLEHRKLILAPAHTIIINAPVDVIVARLKERAGDASEFDKAGPEFHERLDKGYKTYARSIAPGQCTFVDGNRPQEVVHKEVLDVIHDQFQKHSI